MSSVRPAPPVDDSDVLSSSSAAAGAGAGVKVVRPCARQIYGNASTFLRQPGRHSVPVLSRTHTRVATPQSLNSLLALALAPAPAAVAVDDSESVRAKPRGHLVIQSSPHIAAAERGGSTTVFVTEVARPTVTTAVATAAECDADASSRKTRERRRGRIRHVPVQPRAGAQTVSHRSETTHHG